MTVRIAASRIASRAALEQAKQANAAAAVCTSQPNRQFFSMIKSMFGGGGDKMEELVKKNFPNAITNKELVDKTVTSLKEYGYGESTLLASSLCCDEGKHKKRAARTAAIYFVGTVFWTKI
jgi:hypothetical protein